MVKLSDILLKACEFDGSAPGELHPIADILNTGAKMENARLLALIKAIAPVLDAAENLRQSARTRKVSVDEGFYLQDLIEAIAKAREGMK